MAVKLARQSLAQGFSAEILTLLLRLSRKDKEQTQALYREVVDKVREANFKRYYPDWEFADKLIRNFTPPAADEVTYRELINIVLSKALAHGCGKPRSEGDFEFPSICSYVGELLPYIERYSPAQAGRLKHWTTDNQRRGSPDLTQSYLELNDLFENGTVDEILALAPKYPNLEGEIYLRALWKAEALGDLERAQKIASSYTGDSYIKQSMEARVKDYNISTERIEQLLADLQKNIAEVPLRQQVATLVTIAYHIAPQDRKTSLKLLNQSENMVDALKPGKEQTETQIQIAMAYCLAESDRGFAIMETVLPKLNELIAAGAKLDGYDTRYLRDGEWNMTGEGNVGDVLTRLAQGAGYFAWCDFDRAVALTTQFERAEIRMMAQLKLAQGILAGPRVRVIRGALRY